MSSLYYNPSCSKCRTAASILAEHGIDADIVRYLDEPPSRDDLIELMGKLGIEDPRAMMRTGEDLYKELGLADAGSDALLGAIVAHPILLERPIFVVGDKAVVGRPPERVLALLG